MQQIPGSGAFKVQVQRLLPLGGNGCSDLRPIRTRLDSKSAQLLRLRADMQRTPGIAAQAHAQLHRAIEGKILEADPGAIGNIGCITAIPLIGQIGAVLLLNMFGVGHLVLIQMAGDHGAVGSLCCQRPAVEATAGYFRLQEPAIRGQRDFFGAALAAEGMAVGLAVIKDVPLPVDPGNTAVIVAGSSHRPVGLPPVQTDIRMGHQCAAEAEIPVRILAGCIAQLVHPLGGVDEIISISNFSNGAGLEEGMARKAGAVRICLAGDNAVGACFYGEHIRLQLHHIGAHNAVWRIANRVLRFAEQLNLHLHRLFFQFGRPLCQGFRRERRGPAVIQPDPAIII